MTAVQPSAAADPRRRHAVRRPNPTSRNRRPLAAFTGAPGVTSRNQVDRDAGGAPPGPSFVEAWRGPLDQKGTRRAAVSRWRASSRSSSTAMATLLDLSTCGAQVISPTILRPNQRVRMALTDEGGVLRFNDDCVGRFRDSAAGGPQYRAASISSTPTPPPSTRSAPGIAPKKQGSLG
jgi:hypothetical protein